MVVPGHCDSATNKATNTSNKDSHSLFGYLKRHDKAGDEDFDGVQMYSKGCDVKPRSDPLSTAASSLSPRLHNLFDCFSNGNRDVPIWVMRAHFG